MSAVVMATQVGAKVSPEVVETVEVRNRRDSCVSVACVKRCRQNGEWEEPPEQN
jgi:hypothetical protein